MTVASKPLFSKGDNPELLYIKGTVIQSSPLVLLTERFKAAFDFVGNYCMADKKVIYLII